MSIADKLNVLIDGKQQCVNAINNKIDYNKYNIKSKWNDLANEVRRLGFEEGTIQTITDDNVAYSKDLPNGTLPKGFLEKVGGMSYTSENLLDIKNVVETTRNGITYSAIDGVIKFNGTATEHLYPFYNMFTITQSGTYTITTFREGTLTGTFSIQKNRAVLVKNISTTSNITSITLDLEAGDILEYFIISGAVATNLILKTMLVKGSITPATYKPYFPYFSGIRDSKVSEVVSYGANLLNLVLTEDSVADITAKGITCEINNGVITLNGTATAYGTLYLKQNTYKGYYSINLFRSSQPNQWGYFMFIGTPNADGSVNKVYEFNYQNYNTRTFILKEDCQSIYITFNEGMVFDNFTISPMLVKGSTAPSEYVAYTEPTTLPIVDWVQNLEGYGLGIDATYNNYIDCYNKKYVQMVTKQTISNTDYWLLNTNGYGNYYQLNLSDLSLPLARPSSVYGGGICDNLTYARYGYANNKPYTISFDSTGKALIVTTDYAMTLEEFKAWLTENPITIVYALATPIEHDLSAYLPNSNLITLHSNGSLVFNNEYEQDVPNTIIYQKEI